MIASLLVSSTMDQSTASALKNAVLPNLSHRTRTRRYLISHDRDSDEGYPLFLAVTRRLGVRPRCPGSTLRFGSLSRRAGAFTRNAALTAQIMALLVMVWVEQAIHRLFTAQRNSISRYSTPGQTGTEVASERSPS